MYGVKTLIFWRVLLMLIMLMLIVLGQWADDWNFKPRLEYYTYWGVYITFLVTLINVCAAFKYKNSLSKF